jgi:hypothetical protein
MASYVLSAIVGHKQDSYIALLTTWCNHCLNYISSCGGKATSTPSNWYNCNICDYGDFDVCTLCYDAGKRCKERSHELKKADRASMWFPYDEELIRTLEAHGNRHPEDFQKLLQVTASCKRVAFFETSSGWCGSASDKIETGDIAVVLFGSRMPFVLRRHGSGYRLVSLVIFGLNGRGGC